MAEKIWVTVPTPTDPALKGQGILRKPGPRRYVPRDTPQEAYAALHGQAPAPKAKYAPDYFHEGVPELVELTPQVLRHLHSGSLVRCKPPIKQPVGPKGPPLAATGPSSEPQPMIDIPNDTTVPAVDNKE